MPILFIWNTQSEGKGKKIEIGLGNELSQCIFTFHVRAFSQNPNAFVLSATKDDSKTIVLSDCGRERVVISFSTLQQSITFNHREMYAVQFVFHLNIFFPLSAFKIVVNLNYHDDVFSFHRFCVLYFAVFSSCVSVVSALCSRYLYML